MRDYPIFTVNLNATNAGNLREFNHKWYKVFTQRKKNAIRKYTPHELTRGKKFYSFFR